MCWWLRSGAGSGCSRLSLIDVVGGVVHDGGELAFWVQLLTVLGSTSLEWIDARIRVEEQNLVVNLGVNQIVEDHSVGFAATWWGSCSNVFKVEVVGGEVLVD